ncbi:MAG: nicotinamide mononucleotide transporter [Mobilitalea sp.]
MDNFQVLLWPVTILSITGTVLNIRQKKSCFYIWIVTNAFLCVYNYHIKVYAQSILFLVYFSLAIWGACRWHRKKA